MERTKNPLWRLLGLQASLLVLTILLLIGAVFGFLYLRGSWERQTFFLKNDLPYPTITRLYIQKSLIAQKALRGPATYFAYPIPLEPGQQETVVSGGKHFCIAVGHLQKSNDGVTTATGTETWLRLDLPASVQEVRLSQLASYAHEPCPYSFSQGADAYDWAIREWVTKHTQARIESNILDPNKSRIGDSIAGFTLTALSGIPGIQQPAGPDNVYAKFAGQVTLSGIYGYGFNEVAGTDIACFQPTEVERTKLPVLVGQPDQNSHFCFSNIDKAKELFGTKPGQSTATVTIDQYELFYAPAEVGNQAVLISGKKE